MNRQIIHELVEFSNSLKELKSINERNIDEFYRKLEYFIVKSLNLNNDIWVDYIISPEYSDYSAIFGWCNFETKWHIVIAQREQCNIPDSDEVYIYGGVPIKKILDCSFEEKMNVFFKIDLLIKEIKDYFIQEINRSKKLNEEFILKIKSLEELFNKYE